MEWISVKDRLPTHNKPVLIYAESTARQGNIMLVGSCDNGFWFLQNSEATLEFPNLQYEVTHWMPLPEQAQKLRKAAVKIIETLKERV